MECEPNRFVRRYIYIYFDSASLDSLWFVFCFCPPIKHKIEFSIRCDVTLLEKNITLTHKVVAFLTRFVRQLSSVRDSGPVPVIVYTIILTLTLTVILIAVTKFNYFYPKPDSVPTCYPDPH